MSRWAKQITRVGRDSFQLAEAIFRDSTTKRAVSFKPVLLDQARQSNSVAHSLLNLDRQIGLVRYYGIMGYFRQQWQARFSSSLPPSSSYSTTSETSSVSDPNRARIAFMITGSMKQELIEKLGYLEDDIKKMTPLQASLILHHRISADEKDEKLPDLQAEYEKQQEEEALRQKQDAEQREKLRAAKMAEFKREDELRKSQQASSSTESPTETTERTVHQIPDPLSYSAVTEKAKSSYSSVAGNAEMFQSSNLLESPPDGGAPGYGFFGDTWFEVIEHNPKTGQSNRVGLYLDEEEAKLGFQTRQEIAERQRTDLTFELNPVERSTLFASK